MKKKKILFITQDLARTGSEVMLWYLLKNLNPAQYEISVFCLRIGELYNALPGYIEKNVLYKSSPNRFDRTKRRILKLFGKDAFRFQLSQIQKDFNADIWYINTIAIPEAVGIGKDFGVKVVTHIHELLNAFSLISSDSMRSIVSESDVCIGCSDLVCDSMLTLGHPNVKLQYSFLDLDTILVDENKVLEVKKELGISDKDFVWVVSGGALYMKGLDYLLTILDYFKDKPVKIVWIGARFNNGLDYYIENAARIKYPGKLIFTGPLSSDYYNYMSIANGVLLLSREESFSLVMIEAAYLGIPVIAFEVGIAKQFLKAKMGAVIANGDIAGFIREMANLYEHPEIFDRALLKAEALKYSSIVQLSAFEHLLSTL